MKKDYNKATTSDMPIDSSYAPSVKEPKTTAKEAPKRKINAIGKNTEQKAKAKSANTSKKTDKQPEVDKKLRTKLTNLDVGLTDLEKLNDENVKSYRFKTKRNKVVIVLLSILLALSLVAVSTYLVVIQMETNCRMYVHGVEATFLIDGEELSEFRAPGNIRGNCILKMEIKLKVQESGRYNVKFIPYCYQKGILMDNTLIYNANLDLFYEGGDGFYYSKNTIEGDQTILLCGGVILDYEYRNTLNVDNFKMEFYVYFEKV